MKCQKVVVFVNSAKNARKVFEHLLSKGLVFPSKGGRRINSKKTNYLEIKAGLFLGSKNMPRGEQQKTLDQFCAGEIQVVVGTDAFGLGIDLTFQRCILYGLPSNLENYWQKVGRVGRDNRSASAVLYWNWKDVQDFGWLSEGTSDIEEFQQKAAFFVK